MRVLIEYGDHNETFASALPMYGHVESTPRSRDSTLNWHVIKLDADITYAGHDYRRLLIASRWQQCDLDKHAPVAVFTLLIPPSKPVKEGFSYKDYVHVAWCMATVVEP